MRNLLLWPESGWFVLSQTHKTDTEEVLYNFDKGHFREYTPYKDHTRLQVQRWFRILPKNDPSGFSAPHTDRILLKMNTYPCRYLRLIFPYKIGLIRAFTSEQKPIIMTWRWLICPVTILYRLISWKKKKVKYQFKAWFLKFLLSVVC